MTNDVATVSTEEVLDINSPILTEEEISDLDFPTDEPARVTYSSRDFDIHGLVRRINNGDIRIPQFGHGDDEIQVSGYQRAFVWNRPQMDRFIESLLLGFPVPGIFLVNQNDNILLVLDGQQRLRTLQYFFSGLFNDRAYKLANVADEFKGLSYETLRANARRELDNTFIQATIVTASPEPDNMEAIYQIFERLNSGGTQLTAHEIRVALFAGPIIDFLENLNNNNHWRTMYGKKNARIRDQELIARILALYLDWQNYSRPLKTFINKALGDNRHQVGKEMQQAGELFVKATLILHTSLGSDALRRASRQVNNAWTDALFVGLMKRLNVAPIEQEEVVAGYQRLRDDNEYQSWVIGASADEDQVIGRVGRSIEVFSQNGS